MLTTRTYSTNDYPKVLPFLRDFNPLISDNDWQKLLEYNWETKIGYKGTVLENGTEIVGFLSCVFYHRKINDAEIIFCNISTWVVNQEFRSKSLQLLSPLFKIKNIVILNLSPHKNTLSVFNALRFDVLSEFEYLINPYKLKFSLFRSKSTIAVDFKKITEQNINDCQIDAEVKGMIKDHYIYENVRFYEFIIVENNQESRVVLAFNEKQIEVAGFKNKLKELPYNILNRTIKFELLYTNSSNILLKYFSVIMGELVSKTNARSINVSEHFINKTDLNVDYVAKSKKDRTMFFYSENEIKYADINLLYSEKVLLNF